MFFSYILRTFAYISVSQSMRRSFWMKSTACTRVQDLIFRDKSNKNIFFDASQSSDITPGE